MKQFRYETTNKLNKMLSILDLSAWSISFQNISFNKIPPSALRHVTQFKSDGNKLKYFKIGCPYEGFYHDLHSVDMYEKMQRIRQPSGNQKGLLPLAYICVCLFVPTEMHQHRYCYKMHTTFMFAASSITTVTFY